jgi:hypothetical protein
MSDFTGVKSSVSIFPSFRRTLFRLAVVIVAMAAMAALSGGRAFADSRIYYGSVVETGSTAFGTNVYSRSYNPLFATVSPGLGACNSSGTIVGRDEATRSCQLKYSTAGLGGYRSHSDDIFNDTGTSGQQRIVVFDAVSGTGTFGWVITLSQAVRSARRVIRVPPSMSSTARARYPRPAWAKATCRTPPGRRSRVPRSERSIRSADSGRFLFLSSTM